MEIDCSLLEISGEDDSLLQNQSDDVSVFSASPSPFSCSPLLHNRSDSSLLAPAEKGNELMDNRILNQSMEKEFKSMNQPKLSVEGQQMKRKKKGGYNLRKSLAWNRAFFTEEGVLSSSELSLISGNLGNSSGETLSVIHEDGESEMGAVGSPTVALQVLEKKLFKELPFNSPSVTLKRKQNLYSPLGTSRSGSKSKFGGCPKPIVSSTLKRSGTVQSTTLKRPANANTSKGTSKESIVSKLPVSKVDSSVLRTSSKNVEGTSKAKRDHIAKPDKNQKIIRSPGYSLERKEAPKTLLPKFSSHQDRNRGSCTSRTRLAAGIKSSEVSKTDNGIKEYSKQDHVTVDSVTNGHDVVSNDRLSVNRGNFTGDKQQVQQQTAKPSRLRMPSPSLGFFAQLKTSATSNLSQDSNKNHGPQSSIPSVRKFGVQKFVGATGNRKPGVSGAVKSVPLTVTSTVNENVKATYRGSKLMVDSKGPVDLNNRVHEMTNSQQQSGLGDVKQHNKDAKLQNILVNQSGLFEELKEENSPNVNHMDGESQEVRIVRSSVDNETGSAVCGSSKACKDFVNMINDVKGAQADRLSPSSNSNHQTVDKCQGQFKGSSAKRTELFRDLHLENSVEYEPPCSNIGCSSEELQSFYSSAHGIDGKNEKVGASDNKDKSGQFMDKNECIHSSVETLPFSAREQFCDIFMAESQNLVHDATNEEFRRVGKLENSVEYEPPCSNIGCSSGELVSSYCSTHGIDGKGEKVGASGSEDKNGQFMDKNECIHSSVETLPFSAREHICDVSMSESQNLVHDATNEEFSENPAISDSCPEAPNDFQAQLTEIVLHREIISSEELADSDKNEFNVDGKADSFDCKLGNSTVTSTPPLTMQYQHTDLGFIDLRGKHVSEIREASSKEHKKTEEVELVGSPNATDTNNNSQLQRDLPRRKSGSLLSADFSIHAVLAELDSGVGDENCPTVLGKNENKSSADNHCAVSTLGLDENSSCQQGHQVSIEDAFSHNAVPASPSSNQLGDEERPQLEGTNEFGDQTASFLHLLPSLTGEQNIGPVTSSSSRTSYPSSGDSRLVVEDFDETFISRECDSPWLRKEQNQWPVESYNSVTVCPSKGDTGLEIEADQTILFGDLLQYKGVKMRNSSEKKAAIDVSGVEMIQELEKASEPVANEHMTQKSGNDKTEAPATVKPPPSAVPFSDEWLAAFEAAGEEILANKGGAVQNSPPDKSLPEPGPWSPVKRKTNQEIGPFDCTKYTNTNAPGSNER